MYVGTVFGLKEVNLTNKTIRTLLSKDELGGDIYIRELAFYSDDELWIGTESGLYIYNLHTAKSSTCRTSTVIPIQSLTMPSIRFSKTVKAECG